MSPTARLGRKTLACAAITALISVAPSFAQEDSISEKIRRQVEQFRAEQEKMRVKTEMFRAEVARSHAEQERIRREREATVEKTLGKEHPQVADTLVHLAALARDRGRDTAAEPLFQRALKIQEVSLGAEHPRVAQTLDRYAALLRRANRTDEACGLEARARESRAGHAVKNPRTL